MSEDKTILKAAYHTLGCKLNFSETSTIGKMLADRGILRAEEGESPDLIVINTCSVTEMADKKGRQLIRRLTKEHPDATFVNSLYRFFHFYADFSLILRSSNS